MTTASSSLAPVPAEPAAPPSQGAGRRLLLVAALVVVLLVAGRELHISGPAAVADLRAWVAAAGPWGVALFVALFLLGDLCQIPGLFFVAVAVLSYGRLEGGVLGYLTALLSIGVSFTVVRRVGGRSMTHIKWAWFQRILAHLDDHPIRTVALLRSVLCLAPLLSYGLALSSIRFRDYLLGSIIGLIPPVTLFVVFFHQGLVWLGLQ